ncbi:hypothetical protein VNO77_00259 [Canavalia gladiata]|uniref:Uncharacterized protein n=1 Tax=Canavalia gladiata TaxID=3824 RepID=A0AAN9MPQ1_CANGL
MATQTICVANAGFECTWLIYKKVLDSDGLCSIHTCVIIECRIQLLLENIVTLYLLSSHAIAEARVFLFCCDSIDPISIFWLVSQYIRSGCLRAFAFARLES